MAVDPPEIPTPEPPEREIIAMRLAYGGAEPQLETANTYRLQRGFPFQRRGQTIVAASSFKSLNLNSPVKQTAITNGLVDPSKPGFVQTGSNVPTFVTVPFTFNATSTTALTISWPAYTIRRANKTLTTASDTTIPAGSIAITGLTANTQYWYYPFWSEAAKVLGWAGAANATSAGSPAIAQTAQSDVVQQAASFQGFVPLNTLTFSQPAAGTNTVTGGYASGAAGLNVTGGGRQYRIF